MENEETSIGTSVAEYLSETGRKRVAGAQLYLSASSVCCSINLISMIEQSRKLRRYL